MVRGVRPTDLVAFLSSGIGAFANEAATRDRIGKDDGRTSSLEAWLRHWLAVEDSGSAVCFDGGRVVGFAVARRRAARSAWEVTALVIGATEATEDIGRHLLEHLATNLSPDAERLFLRLRGDSPLLDAARQVGFAAYAEERLYGRQVGGTFEPTPLEAPYAVVDRPATHRLEPYNIFVMSVPAVVRSVEGPTWREWRDSRERYPGRRRGELWLTEHGVSVAWLGSAASGPSGYVEVVGRPEKRALAALLDRGLSLVADKNALCLAAVYQDSLVELLRERGFAEVESYYLMMRQIAARQRAPALALALP